METFLLAQADMMRQILQNQQQLNQRRNDQQEKDPRGGNLCLVLRTETAAFSQSGGTIGG
jgi:hypothetical protein